MEDLQTYALPRAPALHSGTLQCITSVERGKLHIGRGEQWQAHRRAPNEQQQRAHILVHSWKRLKYLLKM